ncbi:hypothetical protein EMCRGX_G014901 [Ephydatia muelleri]
MLKELALLVTLLVLFTDAHPKPYEVAEVTHEITNEVEKNSNALTNSDDIKEDMIESDLIENNFGRLTQEQIHKTRYQQVLKLHLNIPTYSLHVTMDFSAVCKYQ